MKSRVAWLSGILGVTLFFMGKAREGKHSVPDPFEGNIHIDKGVKRQVGPHRFKTNLGDINNLVDVHYRSIDRTFCFLSCLL